MLCGKHFTIQFCTGMRQYAVGTQLMTTTTTTTRFLWFMLMVKQNDNAVDDDDHVAKTTG